MLYQLFVSILLCCGTFQQCLVTSHHKTKLQDQELDVWFGFRVTEDKYHQFKIFANLSLYQMNFFFLFKVKWLLNTLDGCLMIKVVSFQLFVVTHNCLTSLKRSWSPGARDNAFNDLRYIWGGFAYLQDMMDHAVIRLKTSKPQPLGVFVQQIPYPCFVDDV